MNRRRAAVGLISGTSFDGIDAAVASFDREFSTPPRLLHFQTVPYPEPLRALLLRLAEGRRASARQLLRANWATGHAFAAAAKAAIHAAGIPVGDVEVIGSHGQTVWHDPAAPTVGGLPSRGTLQIGEAAVIAAETGIATVSDLRADDMAHGGEGAPLVPLFDWRFFTHPARNRVLLNIGGIANLTWLPAAGGPEQVQAWDSGPGNMVIDALVHRKTGAPFDRDGELAAQGTPHPKLLRTLLRHPYFGRPTPKSTGREQFGARYVDRICKLAASEGVSSADLIATATALSAETVADAVGRLPRVHEIFVGGGGCRNRTLMRLLEQRLFVRPDPFEVLGIPADAREAVCFAWLGLLRLDGLPGNLPGATGAATTTVSGKICLPE